jgi:hypothetical protein
MITKILLVVALAVAGIAAVLAVQSRDEIAHYRRISKM